MIPKEPGPGLDPGVAADFRKRSCSNQTLPLTEGCGRCRVRRRILAGFRTGTSMRNARRGAMWTGRLGLVLALLAFTTFAPARAQTVALDELLSAVVHIKTAINPDGRSVANLGREREGTGIVIDNDGLILTIGYLMVEAHSAQVITARS